MRRVDPPDHTCGWSPHYRRTVPNHECERCRLEDELILDTALVSQKKRAKVYRPARASHAVLPTSDFVDDEDDPLDGAAVELRRQTFVPVGDEDLA